MIDGRRPPGVWPARCRRRRSFLLLACLLATVALVVSGCSDGRKEPEVVPPAGAGGPSPVRYVAVGSLDPPTGDAERPPLRTAWPQVLFARSLPLGSVFVDASGPFATVAQALARQVPLALDQKPTLVTVFLGPADERVDTSPAVFARDLTAVLTALRQGGAARVLVAVPPAGAPGATYASQIRAAAQATGSEGVDLPPPDPAADGGTADVVARNERIAEAFGRLLAR